MKLIISLMLVAVPLMAAETAPEGVTPQTVKMWSDTLIDVFTSWWYVLLPVLAIFFPRVRQAIGQGLQGAGKFMVPTQKK